MHARRLVAFSHTRIICPVEVVAILRMALLRCNFTVTSLMPRSNAICLFRRPLITC